MCTGQASLLPTLCTTVLALAPSKSYLSLLAKSWFPSLLRATPIESLRSPWYTRKCSRNQCQRHFGDPISTCTSCFGVLLSFRSAQDGTIKEHGGIEATTPFWAFRCRSLVTSYPAFVPEKESNVYFLSLRSPRLPTCPDCYPTFISYIIRISARTNALNLNLDKAQDKQNKVVDHECLTSASIG